NYNEQGLDKYDLWLLGRYLADGHVIDSKRKYRKNSYRNFVVISIGNNKVEEFKENVGNKYHVTYSDNGSVVKGIITDGTLLGLCKKIGRGSHNKEIPTFIHSLPKEHLKIFLEGYMAGDGGYDKKKRKYYAVTVSKKLGYGLGQLVQKVYETPYTLIKVKTPDKTVIEGREVNQRDYWRITFRKNTIKRQKGYYIDNKLWMPIKQLDYEESFEGNVYNFEVEDDNSYVANNLTVHNCQSFSISGNRLGLKDTRGTLFFEVARIVTEKQPKVILLENVKGLLSDDNGKTLHVILRTLNDAGYLVDFKIINSKEHGVAQSRERVFIVGIREDLEEHRGWVIRGSTVEGRNKRELARDKSIKMFNVKMLHNNRKYKNIIDIMEDDVDERFYVKEEKLDILMKTLEEKGYGNEVNKSKKRPKGLFNKKREEKGEQYN